MFLLERLAHTIDLVVAKVNDSLVCLSIIMSVRRQYNRAKKGNNSPWPNLLGQIKKVGQTCNMSMPLGYSQWAEKNRSSPSIDRYCISIAPLWNILNIDRRSSLVHKSFGYPIDIVQKRNASPTH